MVKHQMLHPHYDGFQVLCVAQLGGQKVQRMTNLMHAYTNEIGIPSILQSGPKVLDHSDVYSEIFPCSPFSMLIHTILARMPLLSATLGQGVGRGNSILKQRVWDYHSISQWTKLQLSVVNG